MVAMRFTLVLFIGIILSFSNEFANGQKFCVKNITQLGSSTPIFAAKGDYLFYYGQNGIVQFSTNNMNSIRTIPGNPITMFLSIDNDKLFVSNSANDFSVYAASTGLLMQQFNYNSAVTAIAVGGDRLFFGVSNYLHFADLNNPNVMYEIGSHWASISALVATDTMVYSGSLDSSVCKWRNSPQIIGIGCLMHEYPVKALVLYGEDSSLLITGFGPQIRQYNMSDDSTYIYHTYDSNVQSLAVSGNYLFVGFADNSIRQWTLSNFNNNASNFVVITGHNGSVSGLALAGGYLISGSVDQTIRIWQIPGLLTFVTATIGEVKPVTQYYTQNVSSYMPRTFFVGTATISPIQTQTQVNVQLQTVFHSALQQLAIDQTFTNLYTVQTTLTSSATVYSTKVMSSSQICEPYTTSPNVTLGTAAYGTGFDNSGSGFSTAGGTTLRITGGNFVSTVPANCQRFNSRIGQFGSCLSLTVVNSGTGDIDCVLPAGVGANVSVSIWLSSGVNPTTARVTNLPSFSYNAPIISSVNPQGLYINEDSLTVTGNNFGAWTGNVTVSLISHHTNNGSASIEIQLDPCQSVTHNLISNCKIPARQLKSAGNYSVRVVVAGQYTANSSVVTLFPNRPPVAEMIAASVAWNEIQGVSIKLKASDADQNSFFFSITQLPAYGSLYDPSLNAQMQTVPYNLAAGFDTVLYKPNPNYDGQFNFTYVAIDSLNAVSSNAAVNVQVFIVDAAPEITEAVSTFDLVDTEPVTIVFPVNDDTEKYWLAIHASVDPVFMHGKWNYNTTSDELVAFSQPLVYQYTYSQKPAIQLLVKHEGGLSSNPYARLTYSVHDSSGRQSAITGTIQVVVKCTDNLNNNIWSGDLNALCVSCPVGAQCSQAGDYYPTNQPGYYPVDLFVYMPCNPLDACPTSSQLISPSNVSLEAYTANFGNINSTLAQFPCAQGYTALRCGQCAMRFYRKGGLCAPCPEYNLTPAVIAVIVLALVLVVLVLVNLLRKIDIGFLGILFSYWQMVSILQTFKLNWPAVVTSTLHYLSFIYLNIELTSPECYMVGDNSQTYELKWYATEAQPLVVIIVIGLLLKLSLIWTCLRSRCARRKVSDSSSITADAKKLSGLVGENNSTQQQNIQKSAVMEHLEDGTNLKAENTREFHKSLLLSLDRPHDDLRSDNHHRQPGPILIPNRPLISLNLDNEMTDGGNLAVGANTSFLLMTNQEDASTYNSDGANSDPIVQTPQKRYLIVPKDMANGNSTSAGQILQPSSGNFMVVSPDGSVNNAAESAMILGEDGSKRYLLMPRPGTGGVISTESSYNDAGFLIIPKDGPVEMLKSRCEQTQLQSPLRDGDYSPVAMASSKSNGIPGSGAYPHSGGKMEQIAVTESNSANKKPFESSLPSGAAKFNQVVSPAATTEQQQNSVIISLDNLSEDGSEPYSLGDVSDKDSAVIVHRRTGAKFRSGSIGESRKDIKGDPKPLGSRALSRRKTNVIDIVTASYGDLIGEEDQGGGENVSLSATLFSIFLLILKLIYINVARKALELFDCTFNSSNNRYYFDVEPNRQCYVSWWTNILPFGIGAIIFYVIGIPALFFVLFYKRRRYLKISSYRRTAWQTFILQATFKRKSEFRPETEYWDVVLLCRKLAIIVCQLMFSAYTAFQTQILSTILLLFLVAHVYIAPYSMRSLNFLEGISLLSSLLVLSCGLMFYVSEFESESANGALAYSVLVIVAISSILVIIMLVYHIRSMYLKHRLQKRHEESKEQ